MKNLLIVLSCVIFLSCSTKGDEPIIDSCPLNLWLRLRVQAPDGSDLLDDKNPLALNKDKIKITYLSQDGTKTMTYDQTYDPKNVIFTDLHKNGYFYNQEIGFWIEILPDKSCPITPTRHRKAYKTLIQWNDKLVDTVDTWMWVCERHNDDIRFAKEVLINGKAIWQGDNSQNLYGLPEVPIRVIDYADLE